MIDMPWQVRLSLAGAVWLLLAVSLGLSYINGDDSNRAMIVGAIIGQATAVIQYYFGSSDGSRKKDAMIAAQNEPVVVKVPGP